MTILTAKSSNRPVHYFDSVGIIDKSLDGKYDIALLPSSALLLRNPGNGKEAVVKIQDDRLTSVARVDVPLLQECRDGDAPAFDEKKTDPTQLQDGESLASAIRRIAHAHEKEMVFGNPYGHVLLTAGEQESLEADHVGILLKQYQFVLLGSGEDSAMLVPVAPGWLNATLELSLRNPVPSAKKPSYPIHQKRYDYVVNKIAKRGIPASAILKKDGPRDSKVPTFWVTVDLETVRQSGLIPIDGKPHDVQLDDILCRLVPQKDKRSYEIQIADSRPFASVRLCSRLRSDVLCARIQSGKPLADTKGTRILMEYLG